MMKIKNPLELFLKGSRTSDINLWGIVKKNQKILASCDRPHDFAPCAGVSGKEKCKKCGGVISNSSAEYYKLGLEDGLLMNLSTPE